MLTLLKRVKAVVAECRAADTSFVIAVLRYAWHRLHGRRVWAHQRAILCGGSHIQTGGLLRVGTDFNGMAHRRDTTLLRVRGRLAVTSGYSLGRGCRVDIGPAGTATFAGGYTNINTAFCISHSLEVGEGTVIAWNCLFLDEDFHALDYPGRKSPGRGIRIGRRVWIGCNVTVLRGAVIPDGCVVAAGAVVSGVFDEANVLLAGNPARVLRREVTWGESLVRVHE